MEQVRQGTQEVRRIRQWRMDRKVNDKRGVCQKKSNHSPSANQTGEGGVEN